MIYTHHILFSLLFIINILFSINSSANNNTPVKVLPFYERNTSGLTQEDPSKQNPNPQKTNHFTDEEIEEMEEVLESSPEKAQDIVKYLQDPNYYPCKVNYRAAFFVGEPGSGKTVTASAIAYKMSQRGWDCKIISSTDLLGEYRNQTATQLKRQLNAIAASKKPTILVIDEVHRLLENSNSSHHDTDNTSTVLWTFLDKQKHNKNFFLIGTMNRINKLPKPFKDRMFSGYIPFTLITDPKIKNKLFRKKLTTTNTHLGADITDIFLDKELEKIGPCSGRNLKLISENIAMMHKGNNEKRPLSIKKEFITQAVNEYIRDKKTMEYDLIEETDEERQERHHKENMSLQEKHHKETMNQQEKNHREQMLFQKNNRDIDEEHLIQQQKFQFYLIRHQESSSNPSIFDEDYEKKLFGIISEMEKISARKKGQK